MAVSRRVLWAVLSVATVFGLPSALHAETIDFRGVGLHSTVSISVVNASNNLLTSTVVAGELNWRWLNGTPTGFATDFYSYCVDALNFLRDPQVVAIRSTDDLATSAPSRPASLNAGAKVAWLFTNYAAGVHASGSGVAAAALQVAVWEALYDASANLATGTFRLNTNGAIRTLASEYLTSLYSANLTGVEVGWLDASLGQDQITQRMPEPSALLLLATGIFVLRRRILRSTNSAS